MEWVRLHMEIEEGSRVGMHHMCSGEVGTVGMGTGNVGVVVGRKGIRHILVRMVVEEVACGEVGRVYDGVGELMWESADARAYGWVRGE